MEKKFIIALTEHRLGGYLFYPYIAELQLKKDCYTIIERITNDDVRKRADEFTNEQKQIVKIIEEYNDSELTRVFSKKKITNYQDFFSSMTLDMIQNNVRPYIERRLIKIVSILQHTDIPIFFKDSVKLVYTSDQLTIENEPAEAIFNFILEPNEFKYFLSISHQGKEMKLNNKIGRIIANDPCHLVIDNKLLLFNDIDGKKLGPFFKNEYINVPKAREKDYLEKFVLNSIKKYKVHASGFEILESKPEPIVQLSLEADLQYNPVLHLTFDYGIGRPIHFGAIVENTVILTEKDSKYIFYKTQRNVEFENKTAELLLSLGLVNNGSAFFQLPLAPDQIIDEIIGNTVNWLNRNDKALTDAGIIVIQTFFDKKYYIHKIEINSKITRKTDWFDVYTVVHFGEYEIPFIRFRKHILTNKNEFILPNGEIVILPKEWFALYTEMFFYGKENGDHFMFNPVHLGNMEMLPGVTKSYLNSIIEVYNETQSFEKMKLPDMQVTLRPYQVEGFHWMYRLQQNNLGACLADDMGLGKTIQTLTLLKKVIETFETKNKEENNNQVVPATLIILPSSLVHNWYNEIQKFAPDLKVLKYVGSNRNLDIETFSNYNIVLTTYGLIRNEFEDFKKYNFLYIILDESQTIKNPDSKIFMAVTELNSHYRLVLTGTPIENSLTDLWSQFEFINPGLLGDAMYFKNYFSIPIEKENDEKKSDRLKKIIQPFILRRTKQEVVKDLPPLTEQVLLCSMSDAQKEFYEIEKSKIRNEIFTLIEANALDKSSIMIITALIKLRQIANHPIMVNPDYEGDSGKFNEIIESLENMYSENHKVIIFSSFVKHLQLFETFFNMRGWKYSMLTGKTHNREEVVNSFQNNPDNKFFLISLKAGGVGLNLTAADYVFILDPWWNPAAEMQAIARAHRIGQKNSVFVYRFISAETIEEKIIKLQEFKSDLAALFINNNNPFKGMSKENIMELFE